MQGWILTNSQCHLEAIVMINVSVNGAVRSIGADATVAALLAEMQLTGKRVAVERNGEIVPKSLHGATPLTAGDQLEIVVAVGGG